MSDEAAREEARLPRIELEAVDVEVGLEEGRERKGAERRKGGVEEEEERKR